MSKLFTIFGNPVSHSISPLIHNFAIKKLNIDACYTRTLLENSKEFKNIFINSGFNGANITVPFKEVAFNSCDAVKDIAKDIKAVNTIIKKDDKLIGYNTDAPGFYEGIKDMKDIKSVLILGAGGTAKAISFILREKGYSVTILNRSQARLEPFIKNGFNAHSWSDFSIKNFDLIVNTTSAGLNDNSLPLEEKLLKELFSKANFAIDVIYGKHTPFLKLAKENKLHTKDGLFMLLNQAVLAFEIFFDNQYDFQNIYKYMRYATEKLKFY